MRRGEIDASKFYSNANIYPSTSTLAHMAEALAIIPLCWEAIKLGKSLMPKAKSASHYVNEVRDLRTKYGVQAFKLRFECDKVIRKASKEAKSADTFSQDFTLSSLSSSDLESRLDAYLGYSRELFIATLEDACQKIKGFEEFFSRFDVADHHGKEVSYTELWIA